MRVCVCVNVGVCVCFASDLRIIRRYFIHNRSTKEFDTDFTAFYLSMKLSGRAPLSFVVFPS